MLRLENIRKQYGDFRLEATIEVRAGYVTGLVGKNGAGKTTAFKAGLGLIRTDDGEVFLLGKPLSQINEKDREEIGVVLADSGFNGYLSGKDVYKRQVITHSSMRARSIDIWILRMKMNFSMQITKKGRKRVQLLTYATRGFWKVSLMQMKSRLCIK